MMDTSSAAPPSQILRQIRRIEIVARRLVDELFAGRYVSTFKGRGMEFSEVREYLPGDDVRGIDWNVTARTGHPFVKKYVEERELTVILLIDASLSLRFGTRGKLKAELAAEIAALLALSALRNNDKAGMLLFSNDVGKYLPPRKTRGHVLRLIREVLSFRPSGRGTSLLKALQYLNRVQRRRAVVFVLSDFLATDGETSQSWEKTLRITQKRHDVIAIPVEDRWENEFPAGVRLLLEDAETSEVSVVAPLQPRQADDYRRRAIARRADLEQTFRRAGVDAIFVQTGSPYAGPFLRFFRERARRLH